MKNNNDRVKVSGTVSRETAEAWKRGDLKSNNGLRQSRGRGSLNSEQPDIWLDETPTFGQQLAEGLKADAEAGIRYGLNRLWYAVVVPKIEAEIKHKFFPWVGRKWRELTASKAIVVEAEESLPTECEKVPESEQDKGDCKVIDFKSYRTA